jgi:hypothetical protein
LNRYEEAATVFMEGLEIDPDNQQLKNGLEEANSHLTGLLLKNIILFIMTGATSGAGTAHPSGAPKFTPVFSGVRVCFVDHCLSFCTSVVICDTDIQ